jgi:hypothetical protein
MVSPFAKGAERRIRGVMAAAPSPMTPRRPLAVLRRPNDSAQAAFANCSNPRYSKASDGDRCSEKFADGAKHFPAPHQRLHR